ncbi:hypothetical protein H2277_09065, partial [Campylobacter sp. W0014]|uniref:hypothetical protein n=1 Tax=Campylobacter sp. W0014 TaxID=2735781 RepID=UPI001EC044E8|nr:hypothetical protein [Campylobacter sp. W0014]
KDILEGSWDIKIDKDINISSKSNYSLSTEDNIDLYTDDCLKLSSVKQSTLINKNLLIDTKEQILAKAQKKIQLFIGNANIQSDGEEILLEVGSSKITINNNGISIKGKVNIEE